MRDWVSLAPGPTLVNDGFMTSTLNIWESSNMQNTLDKDELITGGYVGIFHQRQDRVQGQDHRHRRVSFHFQLLDLCIYFPSAASVPIMKIIMIICGVQPRSGYSYWSPLWMLTPLYLSCFPILCFLCAVYKRKTSNINYQLAGLSDSRSVLDIYLALDGGQEAWHVGHRDRAGKRMVILYRHMDSLVSYCNTLGNRAYTISYFSTFAKIISAKFSTFSVSQYHWLLAYFHAVKLAHMTCPSPIWCS